MTWQFSIQTECHNRFTSVISFTTFTSSTHFTWCLCPWKRKYKQKLGVLTKASDIKLVDIGLLQKPEIPSRNGTHCFVVVTFWISQVENIWEGSLETRKNLWSHFILFKDWCAVIFLRVAISFGHSCHVTHAGVSMMHVSICNFLWYTNLDFLLT